MNFYGIALVGALCSIVALNIKSVKSEYGIIISVSICCLMIFFIFPRLQDIINALIQLKDSIGLDNRYFVLILKITGISYIAEFSSDICRDCGFNTIANQIQTAGKITVLYISIPVILALLESIKEVSFG